MLFAFFRLRQCLVLGFEAAHTVRDSMAERKLSEEITTMTSQAESDEESNTFIVLHELPSKASREIILSTSKSSTESRPETFPHWCSHSSAFKAKICSTLLEAAIFFLLASNLKYRARLTNRKSFHLLYDIDEQRCSQSSGDVNLRDF
jgi:hypothetical protein